MPKLVINPGTSQAREIELKPGAYSLGRGAGNSIQILDASLSANHAQILVQGGLIMVKDLGSTNGTFVNGAPVKYGELAPGKVLRLGWVEMVIVADQAVKTMVAGIPIPSAIAAEALEAARRRRGQAPGT